MAMSDRIFRFPNASFKATKKVEMKYISTMPKMSTYFFSVFIGKYFAEKIVFDMLIFLYLKTIIYGKLPL